MLFSPNLSQPNLFNDRLNFFPCHLISHASTPWKDSRKLHPVCVARGCVEFKYHVIGLMFALNKSQTLVERKESKQRRSKNASGGSVGTRLDSVDGRTRWSKNGFHLYSVRKSSIKTVA